MADLYEDLVAAANAVFGVHPGSRAFHAKGIWCEATFTATPEAAVLTRAEPLQGADVPAIVRFSNGSGDPESNDASREARGMAVKLRPSPEGELDILGTTNAAFATRTPEDFLELLRLRAPDPDTGQPDMQGLGEFLARHPESQAAIQSVLGMEPPASFAQLAYFSPHTFRMVSAEGEGTWVRYRWRPEAGTATIPDDEARERGRDYLRQELSERLTGGTAGFELLIQVAEEGDPLDDPTALWPDERRLVSGGRLEITGVMDDPEGGNNIHVFDPTRVPEGIELSADPVLHARPKAYSVSAYRRLETQ